MLTPFQIESMEIITTSLLAVVVVGTVVMFFVGALTYMMGRAMASHTPADSIVVSHRPSEAPGKLAA